MTVSLLVSVSLTAQTTQWRDIYKAKKKDTIFGIAKKYGISIPELMDANPEMKKEGYELKKGDFVFIPFDKPVQAEEEIPVRQVKNEPDVRNRAIRVGVMLPLHDVDGDGRRMVEYYRGVLMACDSLKKQGISTDVRAWNVPIDADIRTTLLAEGAKDCDIIFGPLYTKQVKHLADFCKNYDIKMVIPFSIQGDEVAHNPQIFQVYQTPEKLNNDAVNAYLARFSACHTVIVDCNDSTSRKGMFTKALRSGMESKGMTYSLTSLKSPDDAFARAFDAKKPNVVVLNTGRSPELNSVLARLNKLTAAHPDVPVSLYGYTDWLMYTKVYKDLFFKYDAYIPTSYFYNSLSGKTRQFEQQYRRWFRKDMQYALPRFAITGFDQAEFFLQGLHRYGKSFSGTRTENTYTPLQTPLNFKRVGNGGMQNVNFQLIHFTPSKRIESINY